MNDVKMKLLQDHIVLPIIGSMDSFTGGVYAPDGSFIEDSVVYRGHPKELEQPVACLPDTYIYGGCLFGHFGHFIWESLARLYAIRQCKALPILFISPNEQLFYTQQMFLKTIGVTNKILLVKKTTLVKNLIYAPPKSSIIPLYISNEQLEAMSCLKFASTEGNRKIWLSRSRLASGRVINEEQIEAKLKKIGYEIIHPELLPFREQVRVVSTASHIAGFDGSQFFSCLFAKTLRGSFFIFNRRQYIAPTLPYSFEKKAVSCSLYSLNVKCLTGDISRADADYEHLEPHEIIQALK